AVEFRLQIKSREKIVEQRKIIVRMVAETQIPFRILNLLERETIQRITVSAASIQLKHKLRGFVNVGEAACVWFFVRKRVHIASQMTATQGIICPAFQFVDVAVVVHGKVRVGLSKMGEIAAQETEQR